MIGIKKGYRTAHGLLLRAACVGEVDSLIRPPSAGDTFR